MAVNEIRSITASSYTVARLCRRVYTRQTLVGRPTGGINDDAVYLLLRLWFCCVASLQTSTGYGGWPWIEGPPRSHSVLGLAS